MFFDCFLFFLPLCPVHRCYRILRLPKTANLYSTSSTARSTPGMMAERKASSTRLRPAQIVADIRFQCSDGLLLGVSVSFSL